MTQEKASSISIILPALNEAENISIFVPEIANVCEQLKLDYEIIVVDDGSTDQTQHVIKELEGVPHFKAVRHSTNQGYGSALKTGFASAQKDWIFFTDADRQFDIREIEKFIERSYEADIIAGYRVHRKDHSLRLLNAWLYHLALRLLFGLHIRDIDCAFKLIKRRVIQECQLQSRGAFINAEFLIKSHRLGYSVVELTVTHYPRLAGAPTGANPKVILRAMGEVIRFRLTGKVR